MSLLELFCAVDDFCQTFEPRWQQRQLPRTTCQRRRHGQLSLSELLTLMIHFHQAHYRDFKAYYLLHVLAHLQADFPRLISYQRFVELMPSRVVPLTAYLHQCFGQCSGISLIGSTSVAACHNRRIPHHKVFRSIAQRGKSSLGWFYGFADRTYSSSKFDQLRGQSARWTGRLLPSAQKASSPSR